MLGVIKFILCLQEKRTNWIEIVMTRAQVTIFRKFTFMESIVHLGMPLEFPKATG
jgi:hypothetical protein